MADGSEIREALSYLIRKWGLEDEFPDLVLDDDVTPTVVVQNEFIRYLFADDACPTCGGREVVFDPTYISEAKFCPDCGGDGD